MKISKCEVCGCEGKDHEGTCGISITSEISKAQKENTKWITKGICLICVNRLLKIEGSIVLIV